MVLHRHARSCIGPGPAPLRAALSGSLAFRTPAGTGGPPLGDTEHEKAGVGNRRTTGTPALLWGRRLLEMSQLASTPGEELHHTTSRGYAHRPNGLYKYYAPNKIG